MYNDIFVEKELPEILEIDKLSELFKRKEDGDINARNLIIKHNIRLVLDIVNNKFFCNFYERKELVSVGLLGLIKAVDLFDIKMGNKFSTFATPCIYNEIRMFLKKEKKFQNTGSINGNICYDNEKDFGLEQVLYDDLDIEMDYTKKELLLRIREIVNELPEKKRDIIVKYFGFDGNVMLTQPKIAKLHNVTSAAISEMKISILKKIKERLYNEGLIERKK